MQQDGDLFAMELLYNNVDDFLTNTARYNGNISAIKWQTAQPTGVTTPVTTGLKAYCYTYDNLNRLLNSKYSEVLDGSWVNNNKYGEQISNFHSNQAYDLNGNIQGIKRKGLLSPNNSPGYIDELLYFYQGNQLVGVDDKTTTNNGGDFVDNFNCYYYTQEPEYGYDANGNLTLDKNKGILNIAYNNLNLPSSIDKTGGYRIAYVYDAAGNKLQQLYYENGNLVKTTDFIGNFVYENDMPSCIVYDEGRVVYANNSRTYFGEVYLKDHLGNVRVAYRRENGVLKTRQVDSYYPFGMNIKGLTLNSTDVNRPNKYLYNGKQMQDEMGLVWLDYGARFYDGVLGRWHSVDPLAEKYRRWSPYNYCVDNPIRFIDPDGMGVGGPGDPQKKELEKVRFYGSIKANTGKANIRVNFMGIPVGYSHNFGGVEQQFKPYVDLYTTGKIEGGVIYTKRETQSGDGVKIGPYQGLSEKSKETNYTFSSDAGSKIEKNPWQNNESGGAEDISVSGDENTGTADFSVEVGGVFFGGGVGVGIEYHWFETNGNNQESTPATKAETPNSTQPNSTTTEQRDKKKVPLGPPQL
jgi:RHS repeat-associated protein